MKVAARRSRRPRKALLPSGEKLHTRLALIEEAQGLRDRRTVVFMPVAKDSKPTEGVGVERADLVLMFPPLFDTEAEARVTVEEFVERTCRRVDLAPVALPWKGDVTAADPPVRSREPDRALDALAEESPTSDGRPLSPDEMREAMSGLLTTGNLLRRHVVRGALTGGQVPPGDDEAVPVRRVLLLHHGHAPHPRLEPPR